jgi:ribosomal protein L1
MGKISKKTKAILEKYDLQKNYSLKEAVEVLKGYYQN